MLLSEVEVHPIAAMFPMMGDAELSELVEDIRKNGQCEPITIWKGLVVDGRNRLRACELLDREPFLADMDADTDPEPWIISQNLHRRHLSASQRAMVAQKLRDYYDGEAKERQKRKPDDSVPEKLPEQRNGDARDKAGEAVGVSGKLVDFAEKVTTKGVPELAEAVTAGKMAVSRAAKIADLPPAEQLEAIETPPERTKRPAKEIIADHIAKALEAGSYQAATVAKALFDQLDERQRQMVCGLWIEWFESEGEANAS